MVFGPLHSPLVRPKLDGLGPVTLFRFALGFYSGFPYNRGVKGDYTLLLSNFVLDITFKRIH